MEELYDTKEAAQRLRIKVSTLQKWVREKRIGFYDFGKSYRFSEKHLEDFIHKGE